MRASSLLAAALVACAALAACDSGSSDTPTPTPTPTRDSVVVVYTVQSSQPVDDGGVVYVDSLGMTVSEAPPRTASSTIEVPLAPSASGEFYVRLFGTTTGAVRVSTTITRNGQTVGTNEASLPASGIAREVLIEARVTLAPPTAP